MIRYILISNKFEGYIIYGYNTLGFLVHFENCTYGMTEDQLEGVVKELRNALSHERFVAWTKEHGMKVVKLEDDLTFERFWAEYGMQRDRMRAEKVWNAMKPEDRQYVLYNIKAYKRYLKRMGAWLNQKFPETYLRSNWRDEWDKINTTK